MFLFGNTERDVAHATNRIKTWKSGIFKVNLEFCQDICFKSVFLSSLHCFKVRKVNFKPQNVIFGDVHNSKSDFKWNIGPAMTANAELLTKITWKLSSSGWTCNFFSIWPDMTGNTLRMLRRLLLQIILKRALFQKRKDVSDNSEKLKT